MISPRDASYRREAPVPRRPFDKLRVAPSTVEGRATRGVPLERGLTFGRLLITYLAVTEALQVMWTGRFSLGPEMIVKALAVPAVQTAALELIRVVVRTTRGSRPIDGLAWFFARWLALAVTLEATTLTVDMLMLSRVDLTAAMFLTLLVTPAIQAAVCGDPMSRAPLKLVWRTAWRHRLVTPILLLDAVMLSAGWGLASHALVGMSEAAVLQRRWMSTKLLAAALVFSIWAARDHETVYSGRDRRVLLGLAGTLAAIAIAMFSPPTLDDAARWLSMLTGQPPPMLLLEIYTATLLIVILVALELRKTVAERCVVAHDLLGWATTALFVATLALLMNWFLSTQALSPWAGLAVTCGSLGATIFLIASVVLVTRQIPTS